MSFDSLTRAESLLDLSDEEALLFFSRPTLVRMPGRTDERALLVSVMLHGNEPAGFRAFLREVKSKPRYACDVYYLVGNVRAAQLPPHFTNRLVPGEENYNRIWVDHPDNADGKMAADLWKHLESLPIAAHLDLHSFTATSTPPHAMVTDEESIEMATFLADRVFHIDGRLGTLIERTRSFGPAVVVECGTNDSPEADDYAFESLMRFLALHGAIEGEVDQRPAQVFTRMTNIKVDPDVVVRWADTPEPTAAVTFRADVSALNITELPEGSHIGWASSLDWGRAKDAKGEVALDELFKLEEGRLLTKRAVVPNLMAAKERIAKESGFYFFERVPSQ